MNHYFERAGLIQATLVPLGRFVHCDDDIAVGQGFTREDADAALLKHIEERCVVDLAQLNGAPE